MKISKCCGKCNEYGIDGGNLCERYLICDNSCTCTPIESPEEILDATPTNTPADYTNLPAPECKPPCEEEWEIEFDEKFGGVRFDMVADIGGEVDMVDMKEEILSFLRSELATAREKGREEMADIAEDMWGLICNVNNGRVEDEPKEWYDAFIRIRAKYFACLSAVKKVLSANK